MLIDRLPISVLNSRLVPGRWDVVAIALVFGLLIYLGEAAHGLTQPLARLECGICNRQPWPAQTAAAGYVPRGGLPRIRLADDNVGGLLASEDEEMRDIAVVHGGDLLQ